jgi:hypothetical protein
VEEGFVAAMNDANAKLAEDSMDVDGEQQAASAAAKKLKHLKDKVMPGVGDRVWQTVGDSTQTDTDRLCLSTFCANQ